MDIYGFTLAFERARNAPTMSGHRIVFRRLRELIEAHDLDGFTALMADINRRMPGAPLSDLAHVWATWRGREDDITELIRNPDWIKSRDLDDLPAHQYEQSVKGRGLASLRDELVRLADIEPSAVPSVSIERLEATVDQPRLNVQSVLAADDLNGIEEAVNDVIPTEAASISIQQERFHATPSTKSKSVMTTWAVCTLVVSICAGLLLYTFLGSS